MLTFLACKVQKGSYRSSAQPGPNRPDAFCTECTGSRQHALPGFLHNLLSCQQHGCTERSGEEAVLAASVHMRNRLEQKHCDTSTDYHDNWLVSQDTEKPSKQAP